MSEFDNNFDFDLKKIEEKLINKFLKKIKAGTDVSFDGKRIKLPVPIVKVSLAGGSCEIGSGFLALMRDYAFAAFQIASISSFVNALSSEALT